MSDLYERIGAKLALPADDVRAVHEALRKAGVIPTRGHMSPALVRRVRRLGEFGGLNARQIAELVGWSRSAVDQVLRGHTHRGV